MSHRTKRARPEPALDFLKELWRLNHALERLSARMDQAIGVTAQQRHIVRSIGRERGVRAGRLADIMHVDPGTVSATLRRLERKGLVVRRVDPDDARGVIIELTSTGRVLDRPMEGTVEHAVEALLATLSPSRVRVTLDAVLRLTHLLDRELGRTRTATRGRKKDRAR